MNKTNPAKKTIIMITQNGMGTGSDQLKRRMLRSYLEQLYEFNLMPSAICFYGEGAKLTCEGSPVLPQLQALAKKGVQLNICMTCLKEYELQNKVVVGSICGMTDIVFAQWQADKVITL